VSAPPATVSPRPAGSTTGAAVPARRSLRDRLLDLRDRIYSNPGFQRWAAAFPLTRPIALSRAHRAFDVASGFVYTQTLLACVRLRLLEHVKDGPLPVAELARRTGLPEEGMERLCRAARAAQILEPRSNGDWGLGILGAPFLADATLPMLVEHNAAYYADLRDPVALLAGDLAGKTILASYWPYGDAARAATVESAEASEYTAIMAATLPPLAEDVIDAYDFGAHRVHMDVGGGEGVFAGMVARRHPELRGMVFDLPAVAPRARARLEAEGLAGRVSVHGGNFHAEPLPTGADIVSLIRVLLDHSDASAVALLTRIRAALPDRGRLLIAEPISGEPGVERAADLYFGFYLLAMGRGRCRSLKEHERLLRQAGFSRVDVAKTRYPFRASLLVAHP
jgi:demethylspheroidene O-methyltransferase